MTKKNTNNFLHLTYLQLQDLHWTQTHPFISPATNLPNTAPEANPPSTPPAPIFVKEDLFG
jgi:hypothetical protein